MSTRLAITVNLDELRVLMNDYLAEKDNDLLLSLTLSDFLIWLRQRQPAKLQLVTNSKERDE